MTTAQIAETSVIVNNNSPIQDYVQPDDQTQPAFEMTPGSNLSQEGNWRRNVSRNCFCTRYRGRAGQLLANFFPCR